MSRVISPLKRQLGQTVSRVLRSSGTARWHRRSSAVIFSYHNVVSDEIAGRVGEGNLHIGVSAFREQMDWVAKSLTVVSIYELLDRLENGKSVGGLAVLTFDDGYTGVLRHAVPVMRGESFPFVLFPVVTNATDRQPFWWDRIGHVQHEQWTHYITTLRGDSKILTPADRPMRPLPDEVLPASWEMLRSVLDDDCTIGVHSVTHRNLATLPRDEIAWELTESRDRIAAELGVVPDVVAYPYARTNPIVQEQAKRSGLRAGVVGAVGLVRKDTSGFDLPRINVPEGISLDSFACWASGLRLPPESAVESA